MSDFLISEEFYYYLFFEESSPGFFGEVVVLPLLFKNIRAESSVTDNLKHLTIKFALILVTWHKPLQLFPEIPCSISLSAPGGGELTDDSSGYYRPLASH